MSHRVPQSEGAAPLPIRGRLALPADDIMGWKRRVVVIGDVWISATCDIGSEAQGEKRAKRETTWRTGAERK